MIGNSVEVKGIFHYICMYQLIGDVYYYDGG